MRILGISLLLAACAGIADAISIKTGSVIVKIDPTIHSSARFAFPVLSNGRTASAEVFDFPAANWVSAVVPVSSLADVETLKKTAGVLSIYENKVYKAPKKPTALKSSDDVPDANGAHKITGVFGARKKLGVTGKGIKVGIVDSGIDWKHPAFGGGATFPTTKVAFGHDFVGDDFTGQNAPVEDDDPMDCGGHGTHCAGIVGANYTGDFIFTGVAPDAIQRAFNDGMDIISMSLGSDGGFPGGAEQDLINQLSATGKVIFSIAHGNAQGDGVWQADSPALADRAISVAATTNYALTRTRGFTVRGAKFNLTVYDNGVVNVGFTGDVILNTLAAPVPGSSYDGDGCTGTPTAVGVATNPAGKVLLLRRGTCTFAQKALSAQTAGALAVIVYNHGVNALQAPGDLSIYGIKIPYYTMDADSGFAIAELLLKTNGSARITYDAADTLSSVKPVNVALFTSWGPGPDLSFKPDVAAPGTNTLSTLPEGSWGVESGTSMATPYTAGIIALYLQYAKTVAAGQAPGGTTATSTASGGYSTIAISDLASSPAGGYSTIPPGSVTSTTLSASALKCRTLPTSCSGRLPTPAYGRRMVRRDNTALLKELYSTDAIFVLSRLQNAGKQLNLGTASGTTSSVESAMLQGGGLIQVQQLLGTRVLASPGKIALGSWQGKQQHTFTIKNFDTSTQKVSISSIHALSYKIADSNNPESYKDASDVLFSIGASPRRLLNRDTLGLAAGKEIVLVSGWISVTAAGFSNNVVFGGLVGDRRNAPLTDEAPGWSVNGKATSDQVTSSISTLKSLGALFRLIIPPSEINFSLLSASTRAVVGTIPALSGVEFSRNNNVDGDAFYRYTVDWSSLEYLDRVTNTTKKISAESYIVSAKFTFVKAINEDTAPVSPIALELPPLVLS
ncbi:hypothetical protein BJ742DRAFT_859239 [Cladochytrium replicatum]|nr:hypothetical protein BJ742DRAFT_859239 [Cladochytrium replicatum]